MAYKLNVSDNVEFDVLFTLNDAGTDKEFGFRVRAKRSKAPDGMAIDAFLSTQACIEMTRYIEGKVPPLLDEQGNTPPAGADALAALCDQAPNMQYLIYGLYFQATAAKAKQGNFAG